LAKISLLLLSSVRKTQQTAIATEVEGLTNSLAQVKAELGTAMTQLVKKNRITRLKESSS